MELQHSGPELISFDLCTLPTELLSGLRQLCTILPIKFGKGIKLTTAKRESTELEVSFQEGAAEISYNRTIHFFRGFSLLTEHIMAGETSFLLTETPQFEMNGAMFDVSQGNAVIRVCEVKKLLLRMALMGLDTFMLYCEDSFTVEQEPYFGYMRAKYSESELRECDDFAALFGIEMIPCIQTLAHLTDTLRWDVYSDIKENSDTLLVGEERTYQLLKNLITAAARPFRTKKIHIGMDEAWHLGRGAYLDKHGFVPANEIMKKHLPPVMKIIREIGLEPMLWSDMFIRPFANKGDYYDLAVTLPDGAADAVPEEASLIYWDYYHFDEKIYDILWDKHKIFKKLIFAGGIWTWTGFCPNWGITFQSTHPALASCKKKGIKQIFTTVWGDNGTECSIDAALMGLSLFAEHGYIRDFDDAKFKSRFEFCSGANYEDFYSLRLIDEIPGCEKDNLNQVNASKYLMWQDPMLGLFDANINGLELNAHYEKLADFFETAMSRNGAYNRLFELSYHVAKVLSVKSELGVSLTKAYLAGNKKRLEDFAKIILPDLEARVNALRACHKRNWFSIHKAVGWDILDMRYGSLLIRLKSATEQLNDYLKGSLPSIEELEEPRLFYNGKRELPIYANFYGDIVSASRIAPKA